MLRIIAALLFLSLSISANAQSNFGLVCSNETEPVPRLLKINGLQLRGFDYGGEVWFLFANAAVDADQISGNRIVNTTQNRFSVNRLTGTWSSVTDMNYKNGESVNGVCVRKTEDEMNALARNYLAQLNNRRAF